MNNLKQNIQNHSGTIAIWLGASSIFCHLLSVFFKPLQFLSYFQVAHIQDYITTLFSFQLYGKSSLFNLSPVSLLLFILLIVSGNRYNRSENKEIQLLGFAFSIIFLSKVIYLINTFLSYYHWSNLSLSTQLEANNPYNFLNYSFAAILSIVLIYISYLVISFLVSKYPIVSTNSSIHADDSLTISFNASRSKRFLHHLFDRIIAIFIIFPILPYALEVLGGTALLRGNSFSNLVLTFLLILTFLIYYLIFEGIFRITPLKFLTNSLVMTQDGDNFKHSSNGQIFIRTFSRFIPFESLSFIFSKGWHDTISNTAVIEFTNIHKLKKRDLWWIVALISFYIIPLTYKTIIKNIESSKYNIIQKELYDKQKLAQALSLTIGDFIIGKYNLQDYGNLGYLLKIISKENKQLVAQRFQLIPKYGYMNNETIHELDLSELTLIDTISVHIDSIIADYVNGYNDDHLDTLHFHCKQVFSNNHPSFENTGGGYSRNDEMINASVRFRYSGTPVNVLAIKTLVGEGVIWTTQLPIESDYNPENKRGNIQLDMQKPNKKQMIKAELILLYNGEKYNYIYEEYDHAKVMYLNIE